METYGCIDQALDENVFNDLINIVNLHPFMSGKIDPSDHDKNTQLIKWHYGLDSDKSNDGVFFNENTSWNRPQFTILFNDNNSLTNYIVNIGKYIVNKHFNFQNKIIYFHRMKLNLGLKAPNNNKHLIPHMDSVSGYHLSMTLLLGNSDGDHIIFKETDPFLAKKTNSSLNELARYNHKNNRLVYNFGHYHCNYDPVEHDHRLALNYVMYFE